MATPTISPSRMARGITQHDYTGHGNSLLDWTPPNGEFMPSTWYSHFPEQSENPFIIPNPVGLSGSTNPTLGGDLDEGHSWVYPIYHWGNPYLGGENTGANPRYLATNVAPDEPGWTEQVHPTYTTKSNLYPHFSQLLDPFDLREDDEGAPMYRILVGRSQLPTTQIPLGEDWFNLK